MIGGSFSRPPIILYSHIMKRLHLISIALTLLCAACNRQESSSIEPMPQAMRNVAQITDGDYSISYSYDSEGLIESISEQTNNTEIYSYEFNITPIINIGEVANPTGTLQDPASTSELEFTKEGYIKREVAKNSENNATLRTVLYTYNDEGELVTVVQSENDRKYTRQLEWSEGNLVSIKNEYFFKNLQYSFYEDITYIYNDEVALCSNHNPQLRLGDKMPIYPTSWYGVPSKNQIASMHTREFQYNMDSVSERENTLNFSYIYDINGYPTQITIHDESNDTTYTRGVKYAN